jgi:hypothetical protein
VKESSGKEDLNGTYLRSTPTEPYSEHSRGFGSIVHFPATCINPVYSADKAKWLICVYTVSNHFSDSLISVVKAETRGTADVPVRRMPRSPVHGGGRELVGSGGWVLAESLWTLVKRDCCAVGGSL